MALALEMLIDCQVYRIETMAALRKPVQTTKENEKKWGKPVVSAGWTFLPTTLLEHQHRLELQPLDLNVLLQILHHWWEADRPPFPSRKAIADRIGRSVSAVQRAISRLQEMELMEITHRYDNESGGQTSSCYTFDGLRSRLEEFAIEKKQRLDARKAEERDARRRRPKPSTTKLKIANPDG